MQSRRLIVLVGLALAVAGLSFISQAQEKRRSLKNSLGEENYNRCGLDKLSDAEEHELMSMMTVGPMPSYAEEAARHFMKDEGWRLVRVIGAVKTDDPFDKFWPVVWDNYELHTLDPFSTRILPDPGVYWAKNTLSSWTILYPDGSEVSFTDRELK
jgi:hypothetical protein